MSKADTLRIKDYLEHILTAIDRINRYVLSMDEDQFQHDEKSQDAVIRNFEVIGEACRNVEKYHPEYAASHPEVPWAIAYEMRNALAHGYFLIDMEDGVHFLRCLVYIDLNMVRAGVVDHPAWRLHYWVWSELLFLCFCIVMMWWL